MVHKDGVEFCKPLPVPESYVLSREVRARHATLGVYAKRRKMESASKAAYEAAELNDQVFTKVGLSSASLPSFLRPSRGR